MRLKFFTVILLSNFIFIGLAEANVQQGLVGWWRFKEGSGTTVADSSGSGNTAALQNGPTWVAGIKNPFALSFNGTNQDCIMSAVTNIPNINAATTYSGWVNLNSTGGINRDVFTVSNGSSAGNQLVVNAAGDISVTQWGGAITIAGGVVPANSWHMMTWTYDGTTNTLYLDGVVSGSANANSLQAASSAQMWIGTWGGGEYWYGSIDDVRIYNRALSAQEVSQLYVAGIQLSHASIRNAQIDR